MTTYRLRKVQSHIEWWLGWGGWVVERWDRKTAQWTEAYVSTQYYTAEEHAWWWAKVAGRGESPTYAEPGQRGITNFELRHETTTRRKDDRTRTARV